MKKKSLLLTVLGAMLSLSAWAAQPATFIPAQMKAPMKQGANRHFIPEPKVTDPTIITKQPEGELVTTLSRQSKSFFVDQGQLDIWTQNNGLANYVIGKDGNIYIQNPLARHFSWVGDDLAFVKLTKSSDKENIYVMKLPQPIETDWRGDTCYLLRTILDKNEEGEIDIFIDSVEQNIEFEFKNGFLKQVDPGEVTVGNIILPRVLFALYSPNADNREEYGWTGNATGALNISPLDEEAVTLPEGAELTTYSYVSKNAFDETQSGELVGAVINNDVYLQVPYMGQWDEDTLYMHGTLEGNKVTFLPQYLGPIKDFFQAHIFMNPILAEPIDHEEGERAYDLDMADKIEFTYDAENNSFTAIGHVGYMFSDGIKALPFFLLEVNPYYFTASAEPLTPKDPVIKDFSIYNDDDEEGTIYFASELESVEGKVMDIKQLSYRIFVDDSTQPYQFNDLELYDDLEEPMIDIPFGFTTDSHFEYENLEHLVHIATPFSKNIGVQLIFRAGEEMRTSKIVWTDHTAISDVKGSTATVVATQYFDLTGRRITSPTGGIFIRQQQMSDGTTNTAKVVR